MKLIDLEERTITIAGKRFLKEKTPQKFGDMREVGLYLCKICLLDAKIVSGYVGPGLNTLRIEKRCGCGSDVDQIDFSKVPQIERYETRKHCESKFLQGIRTMENCCSGEEACKAPLQTERDMGEHEQANNAPEAAETHNIRAYTHQMNWSLETDRDAREKLIDVLRCIGVDGRLMGSVPPEHEAIIELRGTVKAALRKLL